ncbi:MAG: diaminopimelate epimerase [Omnitrophica bacterium GWA2_41_15]|nr:MAG: diaminopimelate epimerase [Omnitrophica bacterium GWA2_41_15]HAZ11135.1 diaminopimelate epimerase [Candidatus Omnitrophota bacterium]
MGKLNFTKMVGAGNDFIVLDCRSSLVIHGSLSKIAQLLCDRKTGIGADGMLVLEKSKIADFRMSVFNADGSVAEMCGNGLRCAVLFAGVKSKVRVETKAGIYEGEVTGKDKVRVKMQEPKDLKLDFPINVNGRKIKINFINTGVPHTVVFVDGLDKIDIDRIGSSMRYHDEFKPKGTNVDFVEIMDDNNIKMRTYERGVEGETLACGTGAVASAIISKVKSEGLRVKINVHTLGGILKVEFQKIDNKIKNVYLEGETKMVFQGGIYV